MSKTNDNAPEAVRLDKWLWAARFFKTRSLATEAINGGRVHLNQQRVKPGRKVQVGDTVSVSIGQVEREVVVKGLSDKRGPAPVAQTLYEETPESVANRAAQKAMMQSAPRIDRAFGKLNKKDRREMRKFKQGFD